LAFAVFDDGGAVLDPVAGVAIGDAIDVNVLGCVNMAADDSVDSAMTSMTDDLIAKMTDMIADRRQSSLQSSDKGTVSMQGCRSNSAPDRVRSQHPLVE
jgi:hypothetical protein